MGEMVGGGAGGLPQSKRGLFFGRKFMLQCQRKENIENLTSKVEVHRTDGSSLVIEIEFYEIYMHCFIEQLNKITKKVIFQLHCITVSELTNMNFIGYALHPKFVKVLTH